MRGSADSCPGSDPAPALTNGVSLLILFLFKILVFFHHRFLHINFDPLKYCIYIVLILITEGLPRHF